MLTESEKTALQTELKSGPLASDLASLLAADNDQAVSDLLNAQTGAGVRTALRPSVTRGQFLLSVIPVADRLAAGKGVDDSELPVSLRAKWQSRLSLVQAGDNVLTVSPQFQGAVQELVSDNLATQDEINALLYRQVSAAEYVLGRLCTVNEIAQAVRDDFGSSLL